MGPASGGCSLGRAQGSVTQSRGHRQRRGHRDPWRELHVKPVLPPRGGWRVLASGHHLCLQPPVPLHTLQPPQPVRPHRSYRLQQVRLRPPCASWPAQHSQWGVKRWAGSGRGHGRKEKRPPRPPMGQQCLHSCLTGSWSAPQLGPGLSPLCPDHPRC